MEEVLIVKVLSESDEQSHGYCVNGHKYALAGSEAQGSVGYVQALFCRRCGRTIAARVF